MRNRTKMSTKFIYAKLHYLQFSFCIIVNYTTCNLTYAKKKTVTPLAVQLAQGFFGNYSTYVVAKRPLA